MEENVKDPLEAALMENDFVFPEDAIQEACAVRNVLRTRALAKFLIDDEGHVLKGDVLRVINFLKKNLYSLKEGHQHDAFRQEHLLRVLTLLVEDDVYEKSLMRITKPLFNPQADQLIRYTLDLPEKTGITDAHTRQAVLAAWMCYLRQNVGSCFATAPAIIVHDEQPLQLLTDLNEILSTGALKRIFGGIEYSVPLSASWGKGDLKKPLLMDKKLEQDPGLILACKAVKLPENAPLVDAETIIRNSVEEKQVEKALNRFKMLSENALLKAWEFTLASFAETKAQFTKWNLYSSLGLKAEEVGGIGACIYQILQEKLSFFSQKQKDLQEEYEQLYTQVKALEGRMKRAASEDELRWLKIEYQTRSNEFYSVEEMRNEAHNKAHSIANLYNVLTDQFIELFPKHFQEVYDAEMQDVQAGPYDDSPAGFRLMYKHGRTQTAQWTMINTPDEFVEALAAFFIAAEREIATLPELEVVQDELTSIVTAIASHVKTHEFIESAFHRMALAHNTRPIKDPLKHLDKIEKKPWVYTSGGAMSTLVSCYFKREQKPTDVDRWVEDPMELLVFLIDTIKQVPPKMINDFNNSFRSSFLMHSPTHAFLLKPKGARFKKAVASEEFTYTFVRDHLVNKMQNFVYALLLDEEMVDHILEKLRGHFPDQYAHFFTRREMIHLYGSLHPQVLRDAVKDQMDKLSLPIGEFDSWLYKRLPFFRSSDLKTRLTDIFSELPFDAKGPIQAICDEVGNYQILDADMLQIYCKTIIHQYLGKATSEIDYHKEVNRLARKHGYAMPEPIIFADTNWVKDYFAFLISPTTQELELWRVDYIGATGNPMLEWKEWLNGSKKEPTWGVYTNFYEYTLVS